MIRTDSSTEGQGIDHGTGRAPAQPPEVVRDVLGRIDGRLWVQGAWRETASGRRASTVDPSTGQILGDFGLAEAADVDGAVTAAAAAFPTWAALSWSQRTEYLLALHERLVENVEHLSLCDAVDAGLPIGAMRLEVASAVEAIRRWPSYAVAATGDVHERNDGRFHYTTSSPFGVVARIVPYNHPAYATIVGMLPVLLAGNTLVIKPSDHTPVSALVIAEVAGQVLPPGVLNVVTGDAATGRALVTHPQVRRIAFTGSSATGLEVQRIAAQDHVRVVSLELSGKNPMLVFGDAELEAVCDGVIGGMNLEVNQGQSCGSTSRVYVDPALYDDVIAGVAEGLRRIRPGLAYADDTTFGPMISAAHCSRVKRAIERAAAQGARVVADAVDVPAEGYFIAPTLVVDTTPQMDILRDEIFGPVIAIAPLDEHAIEEANRTEYGLSASVWTRDIDRAFAMAHGVQAGYVWINCAAEYYWGMPFGGWKDSGIGAQESLEELASYRQTKLVHVKLGQPAAS